MKKYGKLLLSAYIMEKIKSGKSQKGGGIISKYAKLALGAFLLKKLTSMKFEREVEPIEEAELSKAGKGSVIKKLAIIITGVLVGATAIYAFKKYAAKKSGYKIAVK
jgi:hypothetical protein